MKSIISKCINENQFVFQKRLQKELVSLMKEPPEGVSVDADLAEQNLLQ